MDKKERIMLTVERYQSDILRKWCKSDAEIYILWALEHILEIIINESETIDPIEIISCFRDEMYEFAYGYGGDTSAYVFEIVSFTIDSVIQDSNF